MAVIPPFPGEPLVSVTEAARILGHESTAALRKRLRNGTLRGIAPGGTENPGREWMASRAQVENEAVNRGRLAPPPAAPPDNGTLADLRIEMLQGALADAQRAQLERAEELIVELRARLAEKDTRIAQLERQLTSYARSMADVLAAPGA